MKIPKIRTLEHPLGIRVKTPLLLPSFSSKGFRFYDDYSRSENETNIFKTREFLIESMLISAYDLYYKYTLSKRK